MANLNLERCNCHWCQTETDQEEEEEKEGGSRSEAEDGPPSLLALAVIPKLTSPSLLFLERQQREMLERTNIVRYSEIICNRT